MDRSISHGGAISVKMTVDIAGCHTDYSVRAEGGEMKYLFQKIQLLEILQDKTERNETGIGMNINPNTTPKRTLSLVFLLFGSFSHPNRVPFN